MAHLKMLLTEEVEQLAGKAMGEIMVLFREHMEKWYQAEPQAAQSDK